MAQSILTLESFTAQALGLTVGSFAPSTEAALAIGPAVMVVWIVFGGYYVNAGAHDCCSWYQTQLRSFTLFLRCIQKGADL